MTFTEITIALDQRLVEVLERIAKNRGTDIDTVIDGIIADDLARNGLLAGLYPERSKS